MTIRGAFVEIRVYILTCNCHIIAHVIIHIIIFLCHNDSLITLYLRCNATSTLRSANGFKPLKVVERFSSSSDISRSSWHDRGQYLSSFHYFNYAKVRQLSEITKYFYTIIARTRVYIGE